MNTNIFYITLLIFIITNVKSTNISKLLKRNVEFDEEALNNSLSEECLEEDQNSEYSVCISPITLNNYKQNCPIINSKKCQTFYNDSNPTKYFPICSKNPQYNEILQPNIIKSIKQNFEINCLTDENNNLCPYSLYLIVKGDNSGVLDDNCKSKKCTESIIKILKETNIDQLAAYENLSSTSGTFSYESLTSTNSLISKMESDKCKSSHITSNTSGAIVNNTNPILLISLFLFIINFLLNKTKYINTIFIENTL